LVETFETSSINRPNLDYSLPRCALPLRTIKALVLELASIEKSALHQQIMASFFAAIGDLFKSFYELIAAFIGTIVHLFEGILAGIINFFTSIINLFGDVLAGVVDVVGGIGKFVVGE